MTSILIKSEDTSIIQKFLEMGRNKFHLSIEVLNDVHTQNIKAKSKWATIADEMRGTLTQDDAEYLQKCSREIRDGFELKGIYN